MSDCPWQNVNSVEDLKQICGGYSREEWTEAVVVALDDFFVPGTLLEAALRHFAWRGTPLVVQVYAGRLVRVAQPSALSHVVLKFSFDEQREGGLPEKE